MDVIIPRSASIVHERSWQSELSGAIHSPAELLQVTGNNSRHAQQLALQFADFPVRVPRPYWQRIKRGDINDPLLRQVLPLIQEKAVVPGYITDPAMIRKNLTKHPQCAGVTQPSRPVIGGRG